MQLNETFNVNELPEGGGAFDPIPAGWYTATISDASLETTKAGNGQYIKVRYDVTGPSHEGRVVFGNFNIRNPNSKAEEIGRQQLGDLMRATGIAAVTDTDQLIGLNCQIKVAIRKSDEYGDQNEVKGWKSISGSAAPVQQSAPAQSAPQAGSAPPWAK